jgi:hypothetical protein
MTLDSSLVDVVLILKARYMAECNPDISDDAPDPARLAAYDKAHSEVKGLTVRSWDEVKDMVEDRRVRAAISGEVERIGRRQGFFSPPCRFHSPLSAP